MKNGRCQMHGGNSTGPRTPEGLARMAAAHTTHGLSAASGAAARAKRRYIRIYMTRTRVLAAATRLKAYLPPGMAHRLMQGPPALSAPKHPSQVAFEVAVASSSWTVSGGGDGKARAGGMGTARAVVSWRDAERALARTEVAALAPWRAAVAYARVAKRLVRIGGPALTPSQWEIAFRAAGGRKVGCVAIESMDREGGGLGAPSPSPLRGSTSPEIGRGGMRGEVSTGSA